MTAIREITACRSCGKDNLATILSLGDVEVVNMGDKPGLRAPLELLFCRDCTLVQLRHTVDPEYLFRNYYYKSGVNRSMRNELQNIVSSAMARMGLRFGDLVIDIGANDGTLLSFYPNEVIKVGFEPAKNIEEVKLVGGGIVHEFFSEEGVKKQAKVITAIAMFYDLDDPHAFLDDVKKVLADDGLLVIQQNYLPRMLELNAVDNIVHEHLEYYSVTSMAALLDAHGLCIEDVEFNDVNGGSFRTYIRKKKAVKHESASVKAAMDRERRMGLDLEHTYRAFAIRVEDVCRKVGTFVSDQSVMLRKKVYIGGASTRGNTLVQLARLDSISVKAVVDRNPAKWGKRFNGIPIISEEESRKDPPDFMLILPWHFLGEFVEREQEFLRKGGKIIVPLPKPAVLSMEEIR